MIFDRLCGIQRGVDFCATFLSESQAMVLYVLSCEQYVLSCEQYVLSCEQEYC